MKELGPGEDTRTRDYRVVDNPEELAARLLDVTLTGTADSRAIDVSANSVVSPKALPAMRINPAVKDIFAFRYEDFTLEGYEPHPHIKAEVAV